VRRDEWIYESSSIIVNKNFVVRTITKCNLKTTMQRELNLNASRANKNKRPICKK